MVASPLAACAAVAAAVWRRLFGARKHDDGFSRCETRASGDVLVDFPLALTRGDER